MVEPALPGSPMGTPFDQLKAAMADRYILERELGAGGMATVFLAHDPRHNRKVAIKVMRPELAAFIGPERFLKEIETTANLQHPHILPLFDSGRVEGTVFFVMPYVQGESLRNRLSRETQLPVADAIRIATEIAGALDYAHRHGVIHRDIKPDNVLFHDGRALVADFGIALASSRGDGESADEVGHEPRHTAIHESRAGVGRAQPGPADRYLRARGGAVRDADRRAPVHGHLRPGDLRAGHVGGAPPRSSSTARRSRRTSTPPSRARSKSSPPTAGRRRRNSPRR